MVTAEQVYKLLPPVLNKSVLTVENQSTTDIIKQVLEQHKYNVRQADKIAYLFDAGSAYGTCKNIWNFLKFQIPYKIEPATRQTTKTLSRIVYDSIYNKDKATYTNDCKHYAGFTGAILDALGYKFKYRFAGYSSTNNYPTHVYCICDDNKPTIIIDAVLSGFDVEKPYKIKIDKSMSLYKLSGLDQIGYDKDGNAGWEENVTSAAIFAFTGIPIPPKAIAYAARFVDQTGDAVGDFWNWITGQDRKNTEKVKGGVIWFWKYLPAGPEFGKPLKNEDCTVSYYDQYTKDLRKDGIENYPNFEQIFVAWYPAFVEGVKSGKIANNRTADYYYKLIQQWENIRQNTIKQGKPDNYDTNIIPTIPTTTKTASTNTYLMLAAAGLLIGGLIYKGGKK